MSQSSTIQPVCKEHVSLTYTTNTVQKSNKKREKPKISDSRALAQALSSTPNPISSTGKADLRARVANLAEWLPAPDRALVLAACRDGKSLAELARILGTEPRRIARRLQRLSRRVLAPEFALVAMHRARFDAMTRGVANLCIIEGLSERACSRTLGITIHAVRQHRQRVLTLARAAAAGTLAPDSDSLPPELRERRRWRSGRAKAVAAPLEGAISSAGQ